MITHLGQKVGEEGLRLGIGEAMQGGGINPQTGRRLNPLLQTFEMTAEADTTIMTTHSAWRPTILSLAA